MHVRLQGCGTALVTPFRPDLTLDEDAVRRLARRQIEAFRWMVEEFKVSLFAQEVGTAMPVSPKRLAQHLESVRRTA